MSNSNTFNYYNNYVYKNNISYNIDDIEEHNKLKCLENKRKMSYTIYDDIYDNNMDKIYYRVFDYNNEEDSILINGSIPKIINPPLKLNEILSIDDNDKNNRVVNIPMIDKLYIKYKKNELVIDIKNFIYWNYIKNDNIYILPSRSNDDMIYRDIIINTTSGIISINMYKLNKKINDIKYGIVLLYKSYNNLDNQPSTIFFTKKSNKYILKNLYDDSDKKEKKNDNLINYL